MPAVVERRNKNGALQAAYTMRNFKQLVLRYNMPVDAVPIPEAGPELQIITKIHGNSSEKTFRWTIKDEQENTFSGSAVPSDVSTRTMFEQIEAIEAYLIGSSVSDQFFFRITDESGGHLYSTEGFMTGAEVMINDESPLTAAAMFTFMEGDVTTAAGFDGAKPPTNPRTCSGAGSGEICFEWDAPRDSGTGNPAITEYQIRYQGGGQILPVTIDTGGTDTEHTLTGLTPGALYTMQVAAVSNNHAGQFSEPITEAAN